MSSNPFCSPDSTAARRHGPILSPSTSMTTSRPPTAGRIPSAKSWTIAAAHTVTRSPPTRAQWRLAGKVR
jgi:hypothetical protein